MGLHIVGTIAEAQLAACDAVQNAYGKVLALLSRVIVSFPSPRSPKKNPPTLPQPQNQKANAYAVLTSQEVNW